MENGGLNCFPFSFYDKPPNQTIFYFPLTFISTGN